MTHLESLIAEYLDWQGFLVMKNKKVGRLKHGGWEMELDIIGYRPKSNELVHYEPSLDAIAWDKRELRYVKKFEAGRKYILSELFPWLKPAPKLQQFGVFITHPKNRHQIAGGTIISIDELMATIREKVVACGKMSKNAIPEQYPLLRALQLSHNGYYCVLK
jgi:hypothetical protein